MLYSDERHFPLDATSWNAEEVQDFSYQVMSEIDEKYTPESQWPCHHLDRENHPAPASGMYLGVDGVAWGLAYWNLLTGTKNKTDVKETLERTIQNDRYTHRAYFFARTGTQLALQSFFPNDNNLQGLYDSLQILEKSDTNEMMAGAPGAILVLQFLWEMTQDKILPDKIRAISKSVLERWDTDEKTGLPAWKQNYGNTSTYIGAAHGTVGNAFALLRAQEHLSPSQVHSIQEKTLRLLKGTAQENQTEANWYPRITDDKQDMLVHWCHGSPGIIMQLADVIPMGLDKNFDHLLIKAGNLVWNAGGIKKGASLCHGTTGSGAAMLKLFTRTQDEIWLKRARAMAMTSIRQIKEDKEKYKHLRYSLWTGDVGSALFLHACKEGKFKTPMLDVI